MGAQFIFICSYMFVLRTAYIFSALQMSANIDAIDFVQFKW
jgi:hypothetical protein